MNLLKMRKSALGSSLDKKSGLAINYKINFYNKIF